MPTGEQSTRRGLPGAPGAGPARAQLPLGGALGPFALQGELARRPTAPAEPYILLGPERALKLYRLEELRATGQEERVRREAELALELAEVEGVAGALRVGEHEGWLVIEMKRYGATLAEHLAGRESGAERRRAPREYAKLIAGVASTLRRLHRKGVLHRDVKPSNLLFDEDGGHLLLADFSVSGRLGSELTRSGEVLGTDRYLAPECWTGEVGAAADQYALGTLAREVFAGREAPAFSAPLAAVLAQATASDPEQRYPDVEAFGSALRIAVDSDAPRTLGDRLRGVDVEWRYCWTPAALAAGATYVEVLATANSLTLPFVETLAMPLLAGAGALLAFRVLNLGRARRGTVSGWRLLDQWWVPVLVSALALLSLHPLWRAPGKGAEASWWVPAIVIAVFIVFGRLGAYPRRCGWWVATAVERAGRLASRSRLLSTAPAQYLALGAAVLALALAPKLIGDLRGLPLPDPPPASAAQRQALLTVRRFRAALLAGKPAAACALVAPGYIAPGACEGEMGTARALLRHSERRERSLAGAVGLLGFDQVRPAALKLSPAWIPGPGGSLRAAQRLGLADLGPPERHMLGFLDEARQGTMVILGDGPPFGEAELMRGASWAYVVGGRGALLRWIAHCPPGTLLDPRRKCLSPPSRGASAN